MSDYSKWLDWQPDTESFEKALEPHLQNLQKGGSVGFVGSIPGDSPKIAPLPEHLADWPLSVLELLQERAAIMEFDGGMEHAEALRAAEANLRDLWRRGVVTE